MGKVDSCRAFGLRLMRSGLLLCALVAPTQAAVVFNQIPATLDLSYTSYSFSANHSRAIGNYVQLDGTERYLNAVTVTMVTWAQQSEYLSSTYADYSNAAGWNHYVELVLYAVDNTGSSPVLNYVAGSGANVLIPWRPTVVPPGYPETGTSPYPDEGFAFNLNFQFDGTVQLPDQLVVSVNYDTQNYGYDPMLVPGPFNKLNVAADSSIQPTVGTDLSSNVYVSQISGSDYASTLNGNSGGAAPMFKVEASATASPVGSYAKSFGLSGSDAAPDADPDHDGYSNRLEYAFGMNPASAAGQIQPLEVFTEQVVDGSQVKNLCVATFLQRNDVVYTVRATPSLEGGFPVTVTPTVHSDQTGVPSGYTRYKAVYNSGVDRGFIKVDATVP